LDFEHVRPLLDLLPQGIIAVDRNSRVIYTNRAGASMVAHVAELPIAGALSGQDADELEVHVDARGLSLIATTRCARDATGNVTGAIVVFQEVTERKRAEDDLRNAHLFLDSIIENVPNMIFVKEAGELRFERFNRAGEEVLGLHRDVLLGKNDYDFFPKAQADHFQARDRETLNGGTMVDIPEEPIDTPRGRRWLHTKKVPILDKHGRPKHLLGISEDITERKLASDDESRQQQKMEAVGALAGGVAHDFNNMLTVILSCAEMIEIEAPADASFRQDLAQIIAAGRRAAALTQKLLAFSRRQVLQPRVLDVGEVVRGLEEMMRRLIDEDVELRITRGRGSAAVIADRGQLEQVILNLAVNARDAMPKGGVLTIAVGDTDLDEAKANETVDLTPGSYVELLVKDTGVGMSRETMSRIFEPFFTTKPLGKGTGLGLSTVFGVVKQSGGHIKVASDLGRGTTFRILLPRVEDEVAAVELTEHRTQGGREVVMVVEDEPLVRATAIRVLKMLGYSLIEASGPTEALDLASSHSGRIDLLLTDVVMPLMPGRELAEHMRALRPTIRVLFMSGYTDDVIVRHGVKASEVAFLAKPFTTDELAKKVRAVLDGRLG
jgi:PAS domain S-box-containing protein